MKFHLVHVVPIRKSKLEIVSKNEIPLGVYSSNKEIKMDTEEDRKSTLVTARMGSWY